MEEKQDDYDEFLDENTGFSSYQKILCASALLLSLTTSGLTQVSIFASATPEFRCSIPALDEPSCDLTESQIRNLTIPYDKTNNKYATCSRYDVNMTSCDNVTSANSESPTIYCPDGYHYDSIVFGETTITEWNVVCERSILSAVATSLFFAGFFIGSWSYGPLCDWYGRKLPLIVYCFLYIVFALAITFNPLFEVYLALNVFSGAATITAFIAAFTYVTEIAPKKYRTHVTFFCFQSSAITHAILPGLAYAFKDWRRLEFCLGVLPIIFVPFYFFVQESPRWLIAVGREDEAKKIVTKFAKSNKVTFTDEEWNLMIDTEKNKKRKNNTEMGLKKYSLLDLFKLPRMRVVTLAVMYDWFAVSLVFYGLTLNVGNLSGDPYVNSAINAAIELVGLFLIIVAAYFEKRVVLAYSFLFCGIFCLASTVCLQFASGNDGLSTAGVALAVVGKLVITGAFAVTYSATADLFPTVVRGTGISLGSMSARIGSIVTPFTIELQKEIPWLTQTIFGCVSILAFFTAIILPKTAKNKADLTLIEEAEDYYNETMTIWNKFTKKANKFVKLYEIANTSYLI